MEEKDFENLPCFNQTNFSNTDPNHRCKYCGFPLDDSNPGDVCLACDIL
jgi:rubrerythrin